MKEKNIQTLFGKIIKEQGVFELKLAKGNSIPYNALKEHQRQALLQAKHKGIFHKISDSLPVFGGNKHMRFTKKKPFDAFFIRCPAYVAICFYHPREKKEICLIDIDKFLEAEKSDTRKSLTEDKARKIAYKILNI